MSKNRQHRKRNPNANNQDHEGLLWSNPVYWSSGSFNYQTYRGFLEEIFRIALSRFRWHNLPDTCDEEWLEHELFFKGVATIAFPKHMRGKFFSTSIIADGLPNVYGKPSSWKSHGNNGWEFSVTPANGVIVYDNVTRASIIGDCQRFARELTDIRKTKQINRMHAKAPYIVSAPKSQEPALINTIKQMIGGEPAIAVSKNFAEEIGIEVQNFGVPFLGNELSEEEHNCWEQVYRLLGVHIPTYKTERMVADELNNNEDPTQLARLAFLKPRREACRKLNERFGEYLDKPISVTWNEDFETSNMSITNNLDSLAEFSSKAASITAKSGGEPDDTRDPEDPRRA